MDTNVSRYQTVFQSVFVEVIASSSATTDTAFQHLSFVIWTTIVAITVTKSTAVSVASLLNDSICGSVKKSVVAIFMKIENWLTWVKSLAYYLLRKLMTTVSYLVQGNFSLKYTQVN